MLFPPGLIQNRYVFSIFQLSQNAVFLQQIGQASMDRIENAQMNSLGTRKLYYEDVHQTDFTAVVMECVPDKEEGYYCFHAGTKMKDGKIVTNGGRVLGVTAKGATLQEARANAYKATEWVDFENKYMRHDIGKAIDEA